MDGNVDGGGEIRKREVDEWEANSAIAGGTRSVTNTWMVTAMAAGAIVAWSLFL